MVLYTSSIDCFPHPLYCVLYCNEIGKTNQHSGKNIYFIPYVHEFVGYLNICVVRTKW